MKTIEKFDVIGIAVRTVNMPQKAEIDIPQLWEKFMYENVLSQIPNKSSNDVYCIYTDYEGDYTKPYTTLIGCQVSSLDTIPEDMVGITVETGDYQKFAAKGNLMDNIVYEEWLSIWKADIDRAYLSDFEIYKEGFDPENAEIDIFVGVKK